MAPAERADGERVLVHALETTRTSPRRLRWRKLAGKRDLMIGKRKIECSFEDDRMLHRFGREESQYFVIINIVISHEHI
jgi:hypothetical protein